MRILQRDDPEFPREVLLVRKPPAQLWVLGELALLERRCVAIIGSRHPSQYGIKMAYEIAFALAQQGVVIVSGMAIGLDARAHQGALDAAGDTVAVLGCGIDVDYPKTNLRLLRTVREKGLVLTEFEPGTPPAKFRFPQRNRLIAALGGCLIVVEGRIRGGTSNTAEWAVDKSRIFAVPGQIDNELAGGPNLLIQQGAAPYLHPNDVLQHLHLPLLPRADASGALVRAAVRNGDEHRAHLSHAEAELFDLITPAPLHVDVLAARSAMTPGLLLAALSSLELQGLVRQLPGKHFALAS